MHRNTLPHLHPLTGAILRPLGHRKDGRAIWPILGGSEPPAPPADPPPAATPPATPPAAPETPPAAQWDGKVESLPEAAQKIIRDLRKEAGDNRTAKNAEAQRVQAILKAAGIDTGDTEDPVKAAEQAAKERDEAKAAARQTALELAIYRNATAAGADPARLLDSNSFLTSVREVDPTDTAALTAAITKAVADNTWLKAGRAPGASGADHTGGTGDTPRTFTPPKSMHQAIANAYGT